MIKSITFMIFLFGALYSSGCPACNIHNYLYHSVNLSSTIYHGRVLEILEENKVKIEVLEIIKNDDGKLSEIGEIVTEYLHAAKDKVGEEFLFSNPSRSTVKFPVLDVRHSWEVKYLIDSTRVVSSTTEAIILLECVSIKSNRDGREYILKNYAESIDSLSQRIIELRRSCQMEQEDFYNSHRITNLIGALTIESNDYTKSFLIGEIDSIRNFDSGSITLDSLKYNGVSPIGEYLRYILYNSENTKYFRNLIDRCLESINNNSNSNVVYFAYALSFSEPKSFKKVEVSNENRQHITLGVLSSALWNKFYWQKKNISPLLKIIESVNTDPEVLSFITQKFEDYID